MRPLPGQRGQAERAVAPGAHERLSRVARSVGDAAAVRALTWPRECPAACSPLATDRPRSSKPASRSNTRVAGDRSGTDHLRGRPARHRPHAPMVTAQSCGAQTLQCTADAIGARRSRAIHVAWRAQEPAPAVCSARKQALEPSRRPSVSSCAPPPRGFLPDTLRAIASTSWRSQLDSEAACA